MKRPLRKRWVLGTAALVVVALGLVAALVYNATHRTTAGSAVGSEVGEPPVGEPAQAAKGSSALPALGAYGVALAPYATFFPEATADEWQVVADSVCADPSAHAYPASATTEPADGILAGVWVAAIKTRCPTAALSERLTATQRYLLQMQGVGTAPVPGFTYAPPEPAYPSGGGVGAVVICADGTLSNAGGRQGACSWHGGEG